MTTNHNPQTDTPKAADSGKTLARAKGRQLGEADIEAIAALCARQLSESEACRQIGVDPRHWFQFKSRRRRGERYAAALEKLRGARIAGLLSQIEAAADGQKPFAKPDWRAAAELLKFADRQRFGDASPGAEVTVTVTALPDALLDRWARIYDAGAASPPKALPPAPVALLPEGTADAGE